MEKSSVRFLSKRGMPSLHEGSGHGQPEQRRREGRPAPAAPIWRSSSDAVVCTSRQRTCS